MLEEPNGEAGVMTTSDKRKEYKLDMSRDMRGLDPWD